MKYLIFSDLHGSATAAKFVVNKFLELSCDQMICLGDVLYHGPRNDLPEFYDPKKVISILNPYADKILCIQGNCDAEVDQMVLKFKLYKTKTLLLNGKHCRLEHGHHLNESKIQAEVVLFGHTHIPMLEVKNGTLYLNPGSITLPKNNSKKSFMIWEKNEICLYDTEGNLLKKYLF